MSSVAVDDASRKARWMVQRETCCPGDTLNAMRRLANRHGINYAALYALRYRRPSDILMSVYLSISAAYEAELQRQEKAFEHERTIARAKTGLGQALLRLADTLDSEDDRPVGGDR